MIMNPYTPDVMSRFVQKATITSGCWLWKATIDRYGYGQFSIARRTRKAHRVSYELFIGEIGEDLHLDHICRNRNCVNPYHLEAVTLQENTIRGWKARNEFRTNS